MLSQLIPSEQGVFPLLSLNSRDVCQTSDTYMGLGGKACDPAVPVLLPGLRSSAPGKLTSTGENSQKSGKYSKWYPCFCLFRDCVMHVTSLPSAVALSWLRAHGLRTAAGLVWVWTPWVTSRNEFQTCLCSTFSALQNLLQMAEGTEYSRVLARAATGWKVSVSGMFREGRSRENWRLSSLITFFLFL